MKNTTKTYSSICLKNGKKHGIFDRCGEYQTINTGDERRDHRRHECNLVTVRKDIKESN